MERVIQKTVWTLELVRFSHSIFALPFALSAMLVSAKGLPAWRTIFLIIAAMVTARSSAMAFNRFMDTKVDAKNPRTQHRHLPQGLLSKKYVAAFTGLCALLFFCICAAINTLAFLLSPLALAVLLGYSFSKRFTWLSHFWLGLSLGIAPVAAWIAVHGSLTVTPLWLGAAVLFWVAGFDILYATQDEAFDKQQGLHSIPERFGIANALKIARFCHAITLLLLAAFGWSASFSSLYIALLGLIAVAFVWEHSLVKPDDLSKVNAAFFTANGFVSLGFLAGVWVCLSYGAG